MLLQVVNTERDWEKERERDALSFENAEIVNKAQFCIVKHSIFLKFD